MNKAEEFHQHAGECRQLAAHSRTPEEREMLLTMAATWESLAASREAQVTRQQRLDALEKPGGGDQGADS